MKLSHSNKALIITGLIYLLVFGGIFLTFFLKDGGQPAQAEPVAVNLNMFQMEQPKPKQPKHKHQHKPKPPLPEPEPDPEPEPEEIPEETPEEPEEIVEEEEELEETEEVQDTQEQEEIQPEAAEPQIQQPEFTQGQILSAEKRYLADLSETLKVYALDTYPKMAQRRRQEGQIMLSFTILRDGTIKNLSINRSSRNQMLDKAALSIFEEKLKMHFKAFPPEIQKSEWTLSVPIEYKMR